MSTNFAEYAKKKRSNLEEDWEKIQSIVACQVDGVVLGEWPFGVGGNLYHLRPILLECVWKDVVYSAMLWIQSVHIYINEITGYWLLEI